MIEAPAHAAPSSSPEGRARRATPISNVASAACAACMATPPTARIRAARIAVVGVGGVGSWAAEALARSGVAALTLIDLDHVAESNVNRQVQALGSTLGLAKVEALRRRIADIHPGCVVHGGRGIRRLRTTGPACSKRRVDIVVDACDQVSAKAVLAAWALATRVPLVIVGAAGGKRAAERVEVADLASVTHDPVLAALRQRLSKFHGAPRAGAHRPGLRVLARGGGRARGRRRRVRRRRQPQLPRLRLERRRDGDVRHGRRDAVR